MAAVSTDAALQARSLVGAIHPQEMGYSDEKELGQC
jgi:hypothetical protein